MKKTLKMVGAGAMLISGIYFMHSASKTTTTSIFNTADNVSVLGKSIQPKNTMYDIAINSVVAQPVETNQRVTVTAVVGNQSAAILQVSPGLQFWVVDENGGYYPYTAEFNDPETLVGGPLMPNESSTLVLDFLLPSQVTAKTLQFQADASAEMREVAL